MYDELTEQDIKKMEEEIEYRKLVVRKEALEAVKEARAHGDLSENYKFFPVFRYKIVTTVRGNSLKNLISNESPLGKALLGHKVGDRVEVAVNENYSYYVVIRKIENTVDDGSDKIRRF